ncbi:MAG: 1,4-dihydroxy-2-naphthoate octaprenyltransferase [Bacteroidales bacterium]|nr:1,4-dihydroxy-2-naphthoate octaprenyltransferase [Bacteroidales bacterium]
MSTSFLVAPSTRLHAWVLAARPKTLSAALAPVAIAGALAYRHGVLQWQPLLLCALFAALMQVASNFINDLCDFLKGRDTEERLGPERACAQRWITPSAMRRGIGVVLVLACMVGLGLIPYGGWVLVGIGVVCMCFAFLYSTWLAHRGWGDVLVLLFFGLVPVVTTYYVQEPMVIPPLDVWLLALSCGFMVDALLVLNNYRDRHTDAKVGKRTLVVRLGERWGAHLYHGVGLIASILVYISFRSNALIGILALIPYIFHLRNYTRMLRIREGRALNMLLGATSRVILLFTVVVILCCVLAKCYA